MIEFERPESMQIPRPVLIATGLLLLAVLLLAGAARLTGVGTFHNPQVDPAQALAMRDLRFADAADGGVEVRNAADGAIVTVLAPETHGFVRGSLRALGRERIRRGFDDQIPFRVASWPDGRLTLEDPATGTLVDLRAFGETNAESFARLLRDKP
jgi:putative photosynthetic complex assembly protein